MSCLGHQSPEKKKTALLVVFVYWCFYFLLNFNLPTFFCFRHPALNGTLFRKLKSFNIGKEGCCCRHHTSFWDLYICKNEVAGMRVDFEQLVASVNEGVYV